MVWSEREQGLMHEADTYHFVEHALNSVLILAIWTIIVTITKISILDAPAISFIIRCGTGECFKPILGLVALCAKCTNTG